MSLSKRSLDQAIILFRKLLNREPMTQEDRTACTYLLAELSNEIYEGEATPSTKFTNITDIANFVVDVYSLNYKYIITLALVDSILDDYGLLDEDTGKPDMNRFHQLGMDAEAELIAKFNELL